MSIELVPLSGRFIPLVGRKFGELTVIAELGKETKRRHRWVMCQCECGRQKNMRAVHLTSKTRPTRTCGGSVHFRGRPPHRKARVRDAVEVALSDEMRRLHAEGVSGAEIARAFGLSETQTYRILNNKLSRADNP